MPFTFSHPAVLLPLRRLKYLSFSGLLAGCIAPDFEYFIRMKSKYSHTLDGLFWFDLPVSILILLLFFNVIRTDFINNLPYVFKSRLSPILRVEWNSYFRKNWFRVAVSIVIGSSSHILWDSFTHYYGYFVQHFDVLRQNVYPLGVKMPIYRILQHISTILGGLIVMNFILRLPTEKVSRGISPFYWLIVVILSTIFTFISLGFTEWHIWRAVISTMSAVLLALTIAPIIVRLTDHIKNINSN